MNPSTPTKLRPLLAAALGSFFLAPQDARAAVTFQAIDNDANSGISSSVVYTHKLDFGGHADTVIVNGVTFDRYDTAANGTLNFNRAVSTGGAQQHGGNTPSGLTVGSEGLTELLRDMYFNGNNEAGGTTTLTLSGLIPGTTYDTRIYTRQWSVGTNQRLVTFTFDPDGAGPLTESTTQFNQDNATTNGFAAENQPYYINYRFTAVEGENLVITIHQAEPNNGWHLYALTNQVVPEPGAVALGLLGGLLLLRRTRR